MHVAVCTPLIRWQASLKQSDFLFQDLRPLLLLIVVVPIVLFQRSQERQAEAQK